MCNSNDRKYYARYNTMRGVTSRVVIRIPLTDTIKQFYKRRVPRLTSAAHYRGVLRRDNMSAFPLIGLTSVNNDFRGSLEYNILGGSKKR